MTTVQTRSHQIAGVEKFEVVVKRDGEPLDLKTNGVMGTYPFAKALKGTKTVSQWKNDRWSCLGFGGNSRAAFSEHGDLGLIRLRGQA